MAQGFVGLDGRRQRYQSPGLAWGAHRRAPSFLLEEQRLWRSDALSERTWQVLTNYGRITKSEFEAWVYTSDELPVELEATAWEALIGLDYRTHEAWDSALEILLGPLCPHEYRRRVQARELELTAESGRDVVVGDPTYTLTLRPMRDEQWSGLDVLVDGVPLRDYFRGRLGVPTSKVSAFGRTGSWPDQHVDPLSRARVVAALLGDDVLLPSGRVPLLICHCCGNLGCSAIVARVTRQGDRVQWWDWATEDGERLATPVGWNRPKAPFVFDASRYDKALAVAFATGGRLL